MFEGGTGIGSTGTADVPTHAAGWVGSAGVVQAWFQGISPDLEDMSPAWVLREQLLEQAGPAVIAAARFLAAQG